MRLFRRIHEKLGDFWWYSLMLFLACRAADVLNAFVGLWLVPKYVDPSELGAVMPLTNFANFLALPAAAFANTFRNELTRLSVNREFGKLRTLMRGVFVATAIFLFIAIVVARFTLPMFLERIRVVEGALGMLIIAASFVSAVCPVYSNALQALKKFKGFSLINVVGAPVRLLAMLAFMPFRALSGYFIGQAAMPAFTIGASVLCLRRELSVPPAPYWTRSVVKKFATLFAIFVASGAASGFVGLVESTIIRQRLPELESAGYYMATRFSEIATYLYGALVFAFFPFAAEVADDAGARARLIIKSSIANIAFCGLLAAVFCVIGKPVMELLPHGDQYSRYWWAIPWLTALAGLSSHYGFYTTAEMAAGRFGFMRWVIPLDLAYPALMLAVTGHGYFSGIIPESWTRFLASHNIHSLEAMLWWMTGITTVKCLASFVAMAKANKPSSE